MIFTFKITFYQKLALSVFQITFAKITLITRNEKTFCRIQERNFYKFFPKSKKTP